MVWEKIQLISDACSTDKFHLNIERQLMYICKNCGHTSLPYEKANKIVVESREVNYTQQQAANLVIVGTGFETVKEIIVCGKCNNKLQ